MKNIVLFLGTLLLSLLMACSTSHAAVIYKLDFDSSSGVIVRGPGDVVPTNALATVGADTIIVTPTALGGQGGSVLDQSTGASLPNKQGILFTGGPQALNAWTIEAIVKPDLSGCSYGKESTSYIYNSYTYDQANMGDVSLYVDQNTGYLTFSPWGDTTFGQIRSSFPLQSGQWYHIAAIARKGIPQETELWINGALDATGGYPAGWETQGQYRIPSHFRIGGWDYTTTGRNWQGQIDAFAISDTALGIGSFVLQSEPMPPLYGRVSIDGYVGDKSNVGLEIQFCMPGSSNPQFTKRVFLNSAGDYSISTVTPGTYDLAFRVTFSVTKVLRNVTIPSAKTDVSLTSGDVDGDDEVTTTDLSDVLNKTDMQGDL